MKTLKTILKATLNTRVLSTLALCATAGVANAQFLEQYASGILHQRVGGATLGPVNGRRLPVHNIGSSGQDGVEIKMHSSSGGGAEIDIGPFLHAPGAKMSNRRKGWDGLIYGTHRIISNGNNTGLEIYDFTASGATSVRVDEYDDTGVLTGSTIYPGPVAQRPFVPNWTCPDGSTPMYYAKWVTLCNTCNPVLVEGWYCISANGDNVGEFSFNRVIVTPDVPSTGTPPVGTESMIITAAGVPDLDIGYTHLASFDGRCSGLGNAHINEVCTSSTGACSPATEKLVVSNIGSSGQDGVEIKWRRTAGATSGEFTLGDMTTSTGEAEASMRYLLGLRGSALRVTGKGDHAVLTPDYSADGAPQYMVTCYANGAVVAQDTLPSGSGIDVTVDQVVCGPGSIIVYGWITQYNYQCQCYQTYWGVVGCLRAGWGGHAPTYTDRIVFSPVGGGGAIGGITGGVIAGRNLPAPMEVRNVLWTKVCPADFNDDGFLTGEDFDAYVAAFEAGAIESDYNGDGFVTGEDFDAFVADFEVGC